MYVREALIPEVEPPFVSWMAPRGTDDFRKLRDYDLTWRDDARRFEFITLPFPDFAGMNASLDLFFELGLESVYAQVESLATQIVDWSRERGVQLVTPAEGSRRGGVVCVRPRDAAKVSARLKEKGIVHSYREESIRLSPHFYNTRAELAAALDVIAPD
jgi:selenocysteine lyase/cysteine desulfurase